MRTIYMSPLDKQQSWVEGSLQGMSMTPQHHPPFTQTEGRMAMTLKQQSALLTSKDITTKLEGYRKATVPVKTKSLMKKRHWHDCEKIRTHTCTALIDTKCKNTQTFDWRHCCVQPPHTVCKLMFWQWSKSNECSMELATTTADKYFHLGTLIKLGIQ